MNLEFRSLISGFPLHRLHLLAVQPAKKTEDFVTIAETLDKAAKEVGVNFIGGYSAIVSKGMTKSDELLIRSIPMAMAKTERVCSSVNVGSTKTGIDMDAVRLCGEIVKETAEATKDKDSIGCAKFVVLCNAPDDNPFMAGAFFRCYRRRCRDQCRCQRTWCCKKSD